jgi:hypothetical protein
MPAGGLEPPKPTEGQQIYSLPQLPLCDTGANKIQLSKTEDFPRSLESSQRFLLCVIFGSGIRSRWFTGCPNRQIAYRWPRLDWIWYSGR